MDKCYIFAFSSLKYSFVPIYNSLTFPICTDIYVYCICISKIYIYIYIYMSVCVSVCVCIFLPILIC